MDARQFLSSTGPLAAIIPNYEERQQQLEMAALVEAVIANGGAAVIEAATGVGKSLAYLVPALLGGARCTVSTANKTLQAQLIDKDLPLLQRCLPRAFTFAVAKGKGNYVCLLKAAAHSAMLDRWLRQTKTGDLDEAPYQLTASDYETVAVDDGCLKDACPHRAECFYYRAREARASADVLVTNHAMLCQHLRSGHVLPTEHPLLIVDEAHQLEQYAVNAYSHEVTARSFGRGVARALELQAEAFLAQFCAGVGEGGDVLVHPAAEYATGLELAAALRGEAERIMPEEGFHRVEQLANNARAENERAALRALADRIEVLALPTPEGMVRHAVRDHRGLTAKATRFDVSTFLSTVNALYRAVIYTSATLDTGDDFAFFRRSNGVVSDAATLRLGSPFNYAQQAALYLPRRVGVPDPGKNRQGFDTAVRVGTRRLVEASQGGALLLFTSYGSMNAAADYLAAELPYPVQRQGGEQSRAALVAWLRGTPHGVLCATSSFWEGVDIQGENLRLVVIDKLPFSARTPVQTAREAALGQRAFVELAVPEATLRLKQGFGRLIRSQSDYGVVAIFDPRLWTAPYGARILAALPLAQVTDRLADVQALYERRYADPEAEHLVATFAPDPLAVYAWEEA